MAAKKEAAPRKTKDAPKKRNNTLKLSKAMKTMAAMSQIRGQGGTMRQHVLAMGGAEQSFRDNGFLVIP